MLASRVPLGAWRTSQYVAKPAALQPIIYRVMISQMFTGQPPRGPGQFNAAQAQRVLLLIGVGIAIFLLIPLFIFITPYHAIRERAAQFDASQHCRDAAAAGSGTTPCTIEWANVVSRYFSSHSSRSSGIHYYLFVRGGYGDEHRLELADQTIFWRTRNGDAVKLQRWGDQITAVQLTSGESSETTANPDWRLRNEIRGLNALLVMEVVAIGLVVVAFGLRQLRG